MNTFFAQISQILSFGRKPSLSGGVARQLMETAEARAGSSPHQAEELRRAASAYLSVVR
ncbi:MAG: hypothetical protein ACAH21_09375 [Ramlibacter sp.]|nr:hypothetical protein [Ramlibacter sp.]